MNYPLHYRMKNACKLQGYLPDWIPITSPAGKNKYNSKIAFQYLSLTSCLLSTIQQPFIMTQRVHAGCKTLQFTICKQHVQMLILSIQWSQQKIRGHWFCITHPQFSGGYPCGVKFLTYWHIHWWLNCNIEKNNITVGCSAIKQTTVLSATDWKLQPTEISAV